MSLILKAFCNFNFPIIVTFLSTALDVCTSSSCPVREVCNSVTNLCECAGNLVRDDSGVCRSKYEDNYIIKHYLSVYNRY